MIKAFISMIIDLWRYRRWCSPKNVVRLYCAERIWRKNMICQIKVLKAPYPIYIRARTSDCVLIRTVLLNGGGEYPIFKDYAPRTIIDAGANIGLASVFFKMYYPDVTIVAIEPDQENCKMFRMNTAHYDGIHLLEGGLWPDAGHFLRITNKSAASYSFQCEPAETGVPTFTISEICTTFGFSSIDILKIDIEGGEKELFSRKTHWLEGVDNMFIELHDHYAEGASQTLIRAIVNENFIVRFSGENLILTKQLRPYYSKYSTAVNSALS